MSDEIKEGLEQTVKVVQEWSDSLRDFHERNERRRRIDEAEIEWQALRQRHIERDLATDWPRVALTAAALEGMLARNPGFNGAGFLAVQEADIALAELARTATPNRAEAPDTRDQLLAALKVAKEVIFTLHGPESWKIFDEWAPGMQRINAAITAAEREEPA